MAQLHGALPALTPIPIIEPTYFLFPCLFLPKHPTSSLSLFHPKRPVCFCFAQNRTKPPVIRAASRPNSLSFLIPSIETITGIGAAFGF
ncbi:Tetratricopeptide repeat-like superfamily protein [Prunus dulcis]|uniref:Tetratricopeptide repeat-like superfamily protein n=1 Tax=Prunus dulcis TaxID=3755 RepID=A0A4Y1QVV8_PRUDU|nr:Tetratricopeptide repeat-like superfamily protein [Prunus dulcis]